MGEFAKYAGFFLAGAVVAGGFSAQAQLGGQPKLNAAAGYDPNAATRRVVEELSAELATVGARLDQNEAKIAGVQKQATAIAVQGLETKGDLAKLNAAYAKHGHYTNELSMVGGKQILTTSRSSPPTDKCTAAPGATATGQSWRVKYNCQ